MNKLICPIVIIIALVISSCSGYINIPVMKPAVIDVHPEIRNLALINRTLPGDERLNILEGILTAEGIGLDKEGAEATLSGLQSVLQESPRFTPIFTDVRLKGEKVSIVFPKPLDWREVTRICKNYNCDAVIALEKFDSDFIVENTTRQREVKGQDGKTRIVTDFIAIGHVNIKLGFRFYDPVSKQIIDQYEYNHNREWEGKGNNAQAALAQLIQRDAAVKDAGYASGNVYGRRIAPSWYKVSRKYYKKPDKNNHFAKGVRLAQSGDWEGALESWTLATKSGDYKTAGRATYNASIVYEVLGDLETAKEWATRAYVDYKIKLGRDYANMLQSRMHDEERLRRQMEE